MVQVTLTQNYVWRGAFYEKGDRDVPSDLAAYLNLQEQAVAKSPGVVSMVHRDTVNHTVLTTNTNLDIGFELKEFDKLFITGRFGNDAAQGSTCWIPVHAGTTQRGLFWVEQNNVFIFIFPNPLTQVFTVRRLGDPSYTINEIEVFRPAD